MRTREEVYGQWAGEGAVWSPWVKPVLFSEMAESVLGLEPASMEAPQDVEWPWLPRTGTGFALVLDLPGVRAVPLSVALARRGYRPVPLFNGVPRLGDSVVPSEPIARLLVSLGEDVERAGLPLDAAPAFVLDAGRMAGGRVPRPGEFDNRWMVFAQDLPSASFLLEHGIHRVLLVQEGSAIAEDVTHVLRAYRKGGIDLLVKSLADAEDPEVIVLPAGSWLRTVFFRALVLARLHRSSAGGFGDVIPTSSRSGFVG